MDETVVRKALAAAARAEGDAASLLSKMISIPSTSGNEGPVVAFIRGEMEERGFHGVRVDGFGNVHGRLGHGQRLVAFDAHVDTVDVGREANWSFPPHSGLVRDGFVFGRGACDQKGGMAAMLAAASVIRETGVPEDFTLLFVGSVQEEDCDGLCWQYILREEGLKPEAVVITEPTNMGVYRGQRGRLEMDVDLKGVSCHGSAPERGVNAAYRASRVALEIEALNERLAFDAFLGRGTATVTRILTGGPSLCAVPDSASLHVDRRMTFGETPESSVEEVKALPSVKEAGGVVSVPEYRSPTHTGLVYPARAEFPTWKFEESHPAVLAAAAAGRSVVGPSLNIGKWTFSTNGVATGGMFGIPTVGFGPGDETLAHAPDERAPVDHLVKAAAFYALFPWFLSGQPRAGHAR